MQKGYIRPDPRHSETAQTRQLLAFGVAKRQLYVEKKRVAGDKYRQLEGLILSIREGEKDEVVVTEFHRLASNSEDLARAIRDIRMKKAVIVEACTGRRSDCQVDLADMILETTAFYGARSMPKKFYSDMGKKGAEASPVTKPKSGHMPLHDMQAILNDHTIDVDQAVAKIRRDRRYTVKVSKNTIYRWNREGKLKLMPRLAGRKPKAT